MASEGGSSPDSQSLRNLLTELSCGDPVEHYRPLRADPRWSNKLVVPQPVTRVFRGLHGDFRTVQPLLGTEAFGDRTFGTTQVAYIPFRYRLDVTPKMRKRHRVDRWSIYPQNAALYSIPPLTGRRPDLGIWCCLLMYVFTGEEHRKSFWVNPIDTVWDLENRDEAEYGMTYYVDHRPLPVTCAFARIDKMSGTMHKRSDEAMSALVSMLNHNIPADEWRPEPRKARPAAPTRYKLPRLG
jgi:hypothetical protein